MSKIISNRLLFFSFLGALRHSYRSRFAVMRFSRINAYIFNFVKCLHKDGFLSRYFVVPCTVFPGTNGVIIVFRYATNHRLLFSEVTAITQPIFCTKKLVAFWLRSKMSLIFPVLVFETAQWGLITDRQLTFLNIQQNIKCPGGQLVAVSYPNRA